MPTYDYNCPQCGNFEQFQKITAQALETCPTCGSPVQRLISKNVAIIFKGSGFYSTDAKKQKDMARKINAERQVDNQAILDGDINSYIESAEKTDAKKAEVV